MKHQLKNKKASMAVIALCMLLVQACQSNSSSSLCDSTNTPFMALYNAATGMDYNSYDAQVHQYTFKSNINGSICAIGYQGNVNLDGVNAYQMELIDEGAGTVLRSGVYAFTSTARSYVSFPAVSIAANQPYTIRRTVVNHMRDITNTISHLKQIPAPFSPITNGHITIESTKVYEQYNAAIPYNIHDNSILPCIDFVFN